MSQTNMWQKGNPPGELRAFPIFINLPAAGGPRAFYVHHALFENHAEGSRKDMVWLELRTAPEFVIDEKGEIRRLSGGEPAPRQSEFILHTRWPAKLLHELLKEAQKYG